MTISATQSVVKPQDDNPNSMIALALKNNADPEVLKKLMDLQERWEANEARKEYMNAMAGFKRKAPSVLGKDKKVDFTSAKGRTHYNYAGLGGIVSKITTILSEFGLNASWETKQEKDQVSVTCHITHSMGHRESTTLSGPMDDTGNKNRIQMIGSSVTYLQRYTLMSALGLATAEQDDDNGGLREPIKMPTARTPQPEPQQQPQEPATEQPQESDKPEVETLNINGTIEEVEVKSGSKNGKSWKRYGIKIDGQFYGTFDTEVGDAAVRMKGQEVGLNYIVDGKYKTATEVFAL